MQVQEHREFTPPRTVEGCALVRVERLDAQGEAVGRVERWLRQPTEAEWALVHGPKADTTRLPEMCAFVGGLPGELIEADLSWRTPRPGRRRARRIPPPDVRVRSVREASPDRVEAPCPVFGLCGGCQLQHLAYERQLRWKTERVAALLREVGLDDPLVAPALGCTHPWSYRNHMRFSVDRDGRAGLTARGSHRVIPLRHCLIAHPSIDLTLDSLSDCPLPRPQTLVRCGAATGQVLIQPAAPPAVRSRLEEAGLDVRTEDVMETLRIPRLDGAGEGTATFRIRPSSFFQTNTTQANRMAEAVLAGLPRGAQVTLVDAYCGVGTFAALLAPHAGRVLAVEESASAVRDARWNLRDAANVEVVQAKTEDWLPQTGEQRIDGLVIDPPRAGCARSVLDALVARRVPRVVYVSCDPATLARDLAYLCRQAQAYRLRSVQPLDMFPQTAHIETIAILEST